MPSFHNGLSLANSVPHPVPHDALVPGYSCLPTPPSCSIGLPNIVAMATAGQDTTAPSVSPGPGSEGQELIIGPWAKPRACLPARWVLPPHPQNHKVGASGPRQHSGQREGPEGCIWPAEDRVVCVWCGGGEDRLALRGSDCPLNPGPPCPCVCGHCIDGETEANSQDPPGLQDYKESSASLLATPSRLSRSGLCLREAGHILLVAEQPCWEVLRLSQTFT